MVQPNFFGFAHAVAHYRAEAEKARRQAEIAVVAESRKALVEIAERYERLAQWSERYGTGSPGP